MKLSATQEKAWQAFTKACPGKSIHEFADRYHGTHKDKKSFAYSNLINNQQIHPKIAACVDLDRYVAMIEKEYILFLEDGSQVHVFTK